METGLLTLRLCRLRDLRILYALLAPEILPKARAWKNKPYSLLSFYRWMKRTFQVIYLIEVEEKSGRKIVGLVGLYDMELGERLSLSLTVFNPEDRDHGYGEKALTLLLNLIERNGAAKVVYAEVLRSNVRSLRLCKKLGFDVKRHDQDKLLLERDQRRKFEEGR